MQFRKYMHIEKFGTDEVHGIELGGCYVFPKLDGTNGSIWNDGGALQAGSRNRQLSLDADNAGFLKACLENENLFVLSRNAPDIIFTVSGLFLIR